MLHPSDRWNRISGSEIQMHVKAKAAFKKTSQSYKGMGVHLICPDNSNVFYMSLTESHPAFPWKCAQIEFFLVYKRSYPIIT